MIVVRINAGMFTTSLQFQQLFFYTCMYVGNLDLDQFFLLIFC